MPGRPKVRANAAGIVRELQRRGLAEQVLAAAPPGADGWHDAQTISAALQAWQRKPTPVATIAATSAKPAPWGAQDPVTWAVETGRVLPEMESAWRIDHRQNPASTESWLRDLPVTGPVAASGAVSHIPYVTASPPPPRAYANAVAELRANIPQVIAAASAAEPAPEMFAGSGDNPLATASGIDPAALAGLPWRAKLAAAWASNRVDAFRISQDFGGPYGDVDAFAELSGHPAVRDYVSAVKTWARTAGVGDPALSEQEIAEAEAALFGPTASPDPDPQRTGGTTRSA